MENPSPFLSNRAAVCPPDLLEKAKALPAPRVAIAAAGSELPMVSAKEAVEAGIMLPVFVGEHGEIQRHADLLEWDISAYQIIEASGEDVAANAAALACGDGRADVLMKGQLHTDSFMKAVLNRANGLRTESRLVHVFHISHPDGGRPLLVSDAAVNVAPDMKTLQASTRAVVSLLHALGNDRPKVAMLSATETPIPSVPSSIAARELRDWAVQNVANAEFSGPLALDLILSPQSVAVKAMQDDPVAGQADAIIVPDIVSGNALFKSLVYLSGGCAAGVVLGAKVPVLLTSRADPAAARLAATAIAAIISAR